METHEKIRGMREDRDINQTEIGKVLHMSQKKISRIENGVQELTASEIKQYCILFNVSSDWLLGLPDGLPYPKRK